MNTRTPGMVASLLAELDALGIHLAADGERLRFRPREKVTVELAARLKAHKAELLALLATRKTADWLLEVATTWPADWREQWEERAAVAEYDGNMPRPLAEDWAFHLLLSAVLAEQGIGYTPGSISTTDLLGGKQPLDFISIISIISTIILIRRKTCRLAL